MATTTTTKASPKARTRRPGRKTKETAEQKRVTSERISADLVDFKKAGGKVEVLGVTQVLTRVGEADGAKKGATKATAKTASK
ncbi:hypothetical protein [Luteimonas vadosa]|uniref:DNA-binding protein n=1 Tax=Luteimonas vadosa TaxID=1165507 RepID=A0ABP9E733_9GAMM